MSKRIIAAPIMVVLWIGVVVAGDANPAGTVNLNKPGALGGWNVVSSRSMAPLRRNFV